MSFFQYFFISIAQNGNRKEDVPELKIHNESIEENEKDRKREREMKK